MPENPIDEVAARAWAAGTGGIPARALHPLPGGAGNRRYWRVVFADGGTAILMQALPEDPSILPPALRDAGDDLPFVAITRLLARHRIPVPEILGVDDERRWVLLEDLGDRHLRDVEPEERRARYLEAVGILARVHAIETEDALPFRRHFDAEWVSFELSLFVEQLPPGPLREETRAGLEALAETIASLPRVLCLRDYQSENLMLDRRGALRVLDYQDALLAPPELDLASLIHDSYIDLPRDLAAELIGHYAGIAGSTPDPSRLSLLTVQRKCKDFSRFRHLVKVKNEIRFEPAIGRARASVLGALPQLPTTHSALADLLPRALVEASP